ncbi:Hsp20/alpha crystallin family protein [Stratiformator vulcanicus]|uniref:Spore protein SP21 n=1 Tax=Stratiformator vulcanicus TaxID=2527980 RepID=A0A517R340_9PLAN|nr:Hsp20/alpha crystallin family protein [Stratiformator vulcanicus]QDT38271.1 Spore protein SP21 [Stratiformator vulcanicus]
MTDDSETKMDQPTKMTFDRLRRDFEGFVEGAVARGSQALDTIGVRAGEPVPAPVDIYEVDNNLHVVVDLPGVSSDAIVLQLDGNVLGLLATPAEDATKGKIHRKERSVAAISRKINLPVPVDGDSATADVSNGVLSITLPLAPTARSRSIPISTAAPAAEQGSTMEPMSAT